MDNKWFLAQGYNSHTENCKRLHCVLRFRLVSFAIPDFLPPFFKKTAGIEKNATTTPRQHRRFLPQYVAAHCNSIVSW